MAKITFEMFNDQQKEAVFKAVKWYKDFQDGKAVKPYFFLSGYAGTGKTTVANEISSRCAPTQRTVYIAPTGKAASRLKDKGCANAQTLHKFLYHFVGDMGGELEFTLKGVLDETPLLIVCDESSMLGRYDVTNLLSKKIAVLFLGDLGQVPPVKDMPYFTEANCDYKLTDIERNSGNIVRASFFIREGGRLPCREYDDVKVYDGKPTTRQIKQHVDNDGVILCSYNETRRHYNHLARGIIGYSGRMPMIGEKLVCTFNQHSYSIFNGEQVILKELHEMPMDDLQPEDDPQFIKMATVFSITNLRTFKVKINLLSFLAEELDDREYAQKSHGGFDFGYALTIHKAQGSEWDNVLVMEEFLRGAPYEKLMYTAVTRAVKHLTVFRAA